MILILSNRSKRGFSLLEVLAGGGILVVMVLALLPVLSAGSRQGVQAAEAQLVAVLASGTVDRLLARGYDALLSRAGTVAPLDLGAVTGRPVAGAPIPAAEVDGVRFSGEVAIAEARADLLRITVTVHCHTRVPGQPDPAPFVVVRYLAAPSPSPAAFEEES